jgi:UDP-N-acetylmuramoyl-L-alanyl-D-glutamate--2,6-diaminopimelate ligase
MATKLQSVAVAREVDIRGLTSDSRKVAPGYLFAALPGGARDGRSYIDDAIDKGAVAVLAPTHTTLKDYGRRITLVTDDNPRRHFALLAARFFGRQPETVAAVTGTNGKTSVADFTRQIWQRLGRKAASLGTLGVAPPHPQAPISLTTPDPVDLHRCLAGLAMDGFDHLVMEASSHGLDQFRLDGVAIKAAAFTNLSRDHLDYHGDMESYLAAKMRLFTELLADGGTAVLNADTIEYEALRQACEKRGHESLTFGIAKSDLRLACREPLAEGQRLFLNLFGRPYSVDLPLVGIFQASNALAALGLVIATGAELDAALEALATLRGVPGRLELAATTHKGARVYVDYAHTPDALKTVLTEIRPHTEGRLHLVFGCGGDRDRGKRPIMGALARRLADRCIVTDDNPRGEEPAAIRAKILAAVPEARDIGDRRDAIETAIAALEAEDVLVVAGKGHEAGQIVGDQVLPFDDGEVARAAVTMHAGGRG